MDRAWNPAYGGPESFNWLADDPSDGERIDTRDDAILRDEEAQDGDCGGDWAAPFADDGPACPSCGGAACFVADDEESV